MFNPQEQEFLNNFKIQMELQEIGQAGELIQQCNNKYQFAKTHSVYVKDWEKARLEMSKKIQSNDFSQTLSKEVVNEMFKITEELTQEKLAMIRFAFDKKFGESIFNYLGPDGKTKKLFGIFG